jgi:hypothetical protein
LARRNRAASPLAGMSLPGPMRFHGFAWNVFVGHVAAGTVHQLFLKAIVFERYALGGVVAVPMSDCASEIPAAQSGSSAPPNLTPPQSVSGFGKFAGVVGTCGSVGH